MSDTTEALLEVARRIEEHPETYNQSMWVAGLFDLSPMGLVEALSEGACGTAYCMAGHAVTVRPDLVQPDDSWEQAGARILGLEDDLARAIFSEGWKPDDPAGALRLISSIPEPRNLVDVFNVAKNMKTILRGALLAGSHLDRLHLAGLDLAGFDLSGCGICYTTFQDCDFSTAVFDVTCLTDCRFNNCNFSGASWVDSEVDAPSIFDGCTGEIV